jgi:hypothetical protein
MENIKFKTTDLSEGLVWCRLTAFPQIQSQVCIYYSYPHLNLFSQMACMVPLKQGFAFSLTFILNFIQYSVLALFDF